jgi:hypothetical protein
VVDFDTMELPEGGKMRWPLRACVIGLVLPPLALAAQPRSPVFGVAANVVRVAVVVTAPDGSLARDLRPADFELFEDGRRREIEMLRRADDWPGEAALGLDLLLLLDRSASMLKNLAGARTTAAALLSEIPKGDARGVVGLEGEPVFWREPPADPLAVLDAESKPVQAMVATGVDALRPAAGRKALVLLSDGDGLAGTRAWAETFRSISASDVTLYVISYAAHLGPRPRVASAQSRLEKLAAATGGVVLDGYFPGGREAIRRITEDLSAQYILGVQPAEPAKGGYRSLKMKVTRPGFGVRHRDRYLARVRDETR